MVKKITTSGKMTSRPLVINEGVTISNVSDVRKKILKYLKDNHILTVRLNNIENLDLAGIQLLYSIRKTCSQHNRNLKLEMNLSNELIELLCNSGFKNLLTENLH